MPTNKNANNLKDDPKLKKTNNLSLTFWYLKELLELKFGFP